MGRRDVITYGCIVGGTRIRNSMKPLIMVGLRRMGYPLLVVRSYYTRWKGLNCVCVWVVLVRNKLRDVLCTSE
jgi:hypothetical protein